MISLLFLAETASSKAAALGLGISFVLAALIALYLSRNEP